MRFHLIDKVDSWEPGQSVRGRKLTSVSEDYWEDSDDGPVMPPPSALEALCQAVTWLIMITTERKRGTARRGQGSRSSAVAAACGRWTRSMLSRSQATSRVWSRTST